MRSMACVFFLAFAGCESADQASGHRPPPDTGTGGEGGLLISGDACCHDLGPFERTGLFKEGDGPCPDGAPEGMVLHADFIQPDPHTCSPCACGPATCELPTGMLANPGKCADAGGSGVPFGPSAPWSGTCSAENALPAGAAQSVTVPALPVAPCGAFGGEPTLPPVTWGRILRECAAPLPTCPEGEACVPFAEEGLLSCYIVRGAPPDLVCPHGHERAVFFETVHDTRECAACGCGPPAGAACDALVFLSSDSTCTQQVGSVMATTAEPGCVDLPMGTALGSTHASFVTQEAGACTPDGGNAGGTVEPAAPVTLCCRDATIVQ